MDWCRNYKLVKNGDEITLEIVLNPDSSEFSKEFLDGIKDSIFGLDEQVKKLIEDNFADVKINSVKLIMGTLILATIPFASSGKVMAAEVTPTTQTTQTVQAVTTITSLNTTGIVTASKLNVRSGPSTANPIIHALWQENKVKVIGESNNWFQIQLSDGRVGWVSGTYLNVNIRQTKIDLLLSTARLLIGTPYVWGGDTLKAGGFDCSGLTEYVFSQAGYTIARTSQDQAKQGTYVAQNSLQPGDLVFFSFTGDGVISHVGLYIGNGQMINSPKTGDTVKITDITTTYWQSHYVTARRIIP